MKESSIIIRREKVYSHLRNKIELGEMQAGERILEEATAEEMQISRTPVREAIRHLEKDGLVESIAFVGTFVKRFSLKEILDIYDIRGLLEGYAARLLASRINDEKIQELEKLLQEVEKARSHNDYSKAASTDLAFHKFILKNCENKKIDEVMSILKIQTTSFNISNDIERKRGALFPMREYGHDRILDALKKRDSEEAEKMSIMHVKEAKKCLIEALR